MTEPTEAADDALLRECSFVILGQGSLPSDISMAASEGSQNLGSRQNGSNGEVTRLNENESVKPNSWGSEIDPNEIQQKLDLLVKENNLLKETLNQSNLAMKTQFDTLAMWQQEVMKTHESHKQRFLETQEHIVKLIAENDSLKKQVQSGTQECGSDKNIQSKLDLIIDVIDGLENPKVSIQNELKKEIEMLTDKNKDLEKQLDTTMREKDELQEKLQDARDEVNELKTAANKLRAKLEELKFKTDSSPLSIRPVDGDSPCSVVSLRGSDDIEDSFDHLTVNDQPSSTQLQQHVADLAEHTKIICKRIETDQNILTQKSNFVQYVTEECRRLYTTCQKLINDLKMESERHDREKTVFQTELSEKEELLKSKEKELEMMDTEMKKMVLNCEEVEMLRLQVEVFQKDFNDERSCREKAVEEKEALAERVRQLEEMLKTSSGKDPSRSSVGMQQSELKRCFVCDKLLQDPSQFESHLNKCLEQIQ